EAGRSCAVVGDANTACEPSTVSHRSPGPDLWAVDRAGRLGSRGWLLGAFWIAAAMILRQAFRCQPSLDAPPQRSAILPLLDQTLDDGRISECRGIAEILVLIGCDLTQNAPHDLAGSRLRQRRSELDEVGLRDGSDLVAHVLHQLVSERIAGFCVGDERHEAVDPLPFYIVRETDYGSFGHQVVRDERALDLGRPHSVTGDVQHVIHTPCYPVIAVFVSAASVTREVLALILAEVRPNEPIVNAEDGPHLPRPRILHDEEAFRRALLHTPVLINDLRLYAEEGQRRGTGFLGDGTGQR